MNRSFRTALHTACLLAFSTSVVACDVGAPVALSATSDRTDAPAEADAGRAFQHAPVRFAEPPRRALTSERADLATMEGGTCSAASSDHLLLDVPLDLPGSTLATNDAAKTYCADPSDATSAPDQTFELLLADDCTLTMWLETTTVGFEGAFELQTGCATKGDQLACVNGTNETSLLRAMTAGTYYVVVDGMNGTSGDFILHATCATPVCGDRVRNPATEACDGGLTPVAGDGCGDAGTGTECQGESTPAADTCNLTTPVALVMSTTTVFPEASTTPYTTIGSTADYEGDETLFWPALDQVFEFVPEATGVMQVRIGLDASGESFCANDWFSTGCWNHVLYVREDACSGQQLALTYPNFMTDDGVNELFIAVGAGQHYFVFVDGFDLTEYDAGPYYLEVSLLPPQ